MRRYHRAPSRFLVRCDPESAEFPARIAPSTSLSLVTWEPKTARMPSTEPFSDVVPQNGGRLAIPAGVALVSDAGS